MLTSLRNLTVLTAVVVLGLTGCTPAAAPADSAVADDGTITITDHTGNEVEIPADIERVAIDEIPLASTYLAYFEGSAPHLVGMSAAVVDSLKNTVAAEMAPELLEVDTSFYDEGELNIESLLAIKPDVVFYNANNTEHADMFAKAGIAAVGFSTDGDPTTVYADWLTLLEDVFQEPGKMDDVISSGADLVSDVVDRTATVADKQKVLIIFNYAAGTLRVAGETPFFGYYWLQAAGADNAAVGAEGGLAAVTAEQVLAWDPDVVLVGGSGQARITPEQIIGGTVDGLDLTSLRAVKEGRVYSNDLGMWSWFTPNPDAPLVAEWLGSVLYPDEFADVDLVSQTQKYYEDVYGFELTDADATEIFQGSLANE